MDEGAVYTMDSLAKLGFQPNSSVVSDGGPGLSLDFGNLTLHASACLNLRCEEIVLLTGVLVEPRGMAEIQFEMPRRLRSHKFCAASIVWSLDQHSDSSVFKADRHIGWIEEGRQNRKLLPWVRRGAEFEARPQCSVRRAWFRLALKNLKESIAHLPDSSGVVFSFDGSVFSIRCENDVIALSGKGFPWTVAFKVEVRELRSLPGRFMREDVHISIWESRITLGNQAYAGSIQPGAEKSLRAQ